MVAQAFSLSRREGVNRSLALLVIALLVGLLLVSREACSHRHP